MTDGLKSDDLKLRLRDFEATVDPDDPQQVELLEKIRTQTLALQQSRGDWSKPSTFRSWNEETKPLERSPLELESYRDYARAQRAPLALEASSLAQNTLANSTTGCSSSVLSHKLSARRLVKEESRDAFSGSEAVAES
ncbi:hypothetical protein WJX84_006133 [Apatococcus fuscideae]|uniref:Uncharacterized protein n=1 Tax=Apatococcus fuscideae TaxID=2026836 RepID=A0AAW1TG78_9CHLO